MSEITILDVFVKVSTLLSNDPDCRNVVVSVDLEDDSVQIRMKTGSRKSLNSPNSVHEPVSETSLNSSDPVYKPQSVSVRSVSGTSHDSSDPVQEPQSVSVRFLTGRMREKW